MALEKYPVMSELGDYKVEIVKQHVALGAYRWIAKVYVKRQTPRFYQRKFKLIYEKETGWSQYEEIANNLVAFAQDAVFDYEYSVYKKERDRRTQEKSIEEFVNWDGMIRENEGADAIDGN
ncbi:hypothetical protein GJU41_11830 [Bacillus idriensis]|uniref:Uncharacterized protein n=1 Tax=Metabacillus idriensis TaxID=324768 RepID=A0A6I2MBJ8_9BACI|nr:hypothetical protein [Metabacillus idriensis]MRX54662.1 hypothetical protein [Metabacillus idriensis]